MKYIICSLVLVLTFSINSKAQYNSTIYIDPSYSGSESNGSLQTPYKSWLDITIWSDSTLYLQRKGTMDTINGSILVSHKTNIKFGVYGDGSNFAHLHNLSSSPTFTVHSCNHSIIDGFHLSGPYVMDTVRYLDGSYTGTAIYIKDDSNDPTFNSYGNRVVNCFIEEFNTGIAVIKFTNSLFDTITIENVKIHNITQDGIFVQSLAGRDAPLRNVDINNCYIDSVNMAYQFTGGGGQEIAYGVAIQSSRCVTGITVRNSFIDRRNSGNKFAIIFNDEDGTNTCNALVENCTIYAPDEGGAAIYLQSFDSVVFRNNFIFSNENSISFMTRSGTSLSCFYNVFSRMPSGKQSMVFDLYAGPNMIHNNTFYGADQVFVSQGYKTEVLNNIFDSAGTVYVGNVLAAPDNNLYHNSNVSTTEPNSVYGQDPLFIDPDNGNFDLSINSPCINKGKDLGLTADIKGTEVPQGLAPEIGAYEYIPVSTYAPSVPCKLKAYQIKYTRFFLKWKPSFDDIGVTGYDVYKNGKLVASVSQPYALITGLTQGATYNMRVKAKDGDGNVSASSHKLRVKTHCARDKESPAAPTGLVVSNISQVDLMLRWNSSTDNVGVVVYEVYNGDLLVASTADTVALITGLGTGETYTITVKAKDAVGNFAISEELVVSTLPTCETTDPWTNTNFMIPLYGSTGPVTVEYNVIPVGSSMNGVTGVSQEDVSAYSGLSCIVRFFSNGLVDAYQGDGSGGGSYAIGGDTLEYIAGTTYHVRLVIDIPAKIYSAYVKPDNETKEYLIGYQFPFRYQANCLNNFVYKTESCRLMINNLSVDFIPDTMAPSVPSGLTYEDVTETSFVLRWNASTDNETVLAYTIFQDGIYLETTSDTTISIGNLTAGTSYIITATAIDPSGNESEFSEELVVETVLTTNLSSKEIALKSFLINRSTYLSNVFELYPIPASSFVNVKVSCPSEIKIMDITGGNVLYSKTIEMGVTTIPLNLSTGIYIVQVTAETKKSGTHILIIR